MGWYELPLCSKVHKAFTSTFDGINHTTAKIMIASITQRYPAIDIHTPTTAADDAILKCLFPL